MREAAVLSSPSDALETPHARTLTWFRLEDAAFHAVTKAAAVAVLLVLGSVIVALVYGALPAFRAFGWDFLISARWNPVTEKFGALAPGRHLAPRHADRRSGRPRGCDLPDRTLPSAAAAAGRHRHRAS